MRSKEQIHDNNRELYILAESILGSISTEADILETYEQIKILINDSENMIFKKGNSFVASSYS